MRLQTGQRCTRHLFSDADKMFLIYRNVKRSVDFLLVLNSIELGFSFLPFFSVSNKTSLKVGGKGLRVRSPTVKNIPGET